MNELMQYPIAIIALTIACEAITEIIGYSTLFEPVRNFIVARNVPFFGKLLSCKYCLSVWVSIILVSAHYFVYNGVRLGALGLLAYTCAIFIVHRASNFLHLFFDIVREYRLWRWTTDLSDNEKQGG